MYLERLRLDGKVAVVTGGSQGIGLAAGKALAEFGATLVIASNMPDRGHAAVAELAAAGHRARFIDLDVRNADAVRRAMEDVVAQEGRLDVLVNNAGGALHGPATELPDDEWQRVIDVNLTGSFWAAREAARQMVLSGGGAIVNVGSISGMIANIPQSQTAYNASKAGVHLITQTLATEIPPRKIREHEEAPG